VLGAVTGTWPFAVLEFGPTGLSLRMRSFVRMFRPEDLTATPATLRHARPARGLMSRGVGFVDRQGREFYFWTARPDDVLELLGQQGYPVTRA
jgi:hypothetical protein